MKLTGAVMQQSGAGLVMALVMLLVMSIAALALVNSVNAGLRASGNFAFRQAAVLAADAGSEAAVRWLTAQAGSATLFSDQPVLGYYASVLPDIDLSGAGDLTAAATVDWYDDACAARPGTACLRPAPTLATDPAGHRVRYLIQRLCRSAGSPEAATNSCLLFRPPQGGSTSRGQLSYGAAARFQPDDGVYYRITVQVRGPRDTTAFTQTLVHD